MLQSTFETRCSSAKIQFNNIQHIKKLEQENKRKDEENRKVNRKFAEQGAALSVLTSQVDSTRRQLKESEEKRADQEMKLVQQMSSQRQQHEEEMRRLRREGEEQRCERERERVRERQRERERDEQIRELSSKVTELKLENRRSSDNDRTYYNPMLGATPTVYRKFHSNVIMLGLH